MKLIDEYLNFLYYQKNYSVNTINKYKKILNEYQNFLRKENKEYNKIKLNEIELFIKKLYQRNLSNNSV